jgi:hypothetical protein
MSIDFYIYHSTYGYHERFWCEVALLEHSYLQSRDFMISSASPTVARRTILPSTLHNNAPKSTIPFA